MARSNIGFSKLLLFAFLGSTFAAPIFQPKGEIEQPTGFESEKRQTQANPLQMTVDVSNWQDIAEENCYVMLCDYNGQRVWRRNPTQTNNHYTESGASLVPFRASNLSSRGTTQIDSTTTSAEEFPWQGMAQGGNGAHLFPASRANQNSQGGSINAAFNRANVNYGDWFEITYQNYDTSRVYCKALFSNPPDTSVCQQKKKTKLYNKNVFPGDYDYVKVPNTLPITFKHS
ncbi:hypothetical protein F5X99DRAFT_431853 [Biscogniauxia marginata]|nr:hypothetical protein F5X99DRAFT_431853 [Biscogniauxia marginata]